MTANHRALDASDIALIEKVKGTPSLYDAGSPDFKFAYRKEQLWENVASVLTMSATDARRRWTCLRDRYSRELKQMRMHPEKSEYGCNDFFRQMDFLRKFVRKRRERRRIDSKYKCDSSWDGSCLDDSTKMQTKIQSDDDDDDDEEHATIATDNYDQHTQQYTTKVEVKTAADDEEEEDEEDDGEDDGYPEFVEDGQIGEGYEEYVEQQQPVAHSPAALTKYAISCVGATTLTMPRQSSQQQNNIPIAYINNAAATTASAAAGNSYALTMHKTESAPAQPVTPNISSSNNTTTGGEALATEDDFFCKTIGSYLRQLSRRHKIKAKIEMFQILEKYIELEDMCRAERKG